MLYSALALMVFAVIAFILDFAGVMPGAAGVSNIALLLSFLLLAVRAVVSVSHHWRTQHHH